MISLILPAGDLGHLAEVAAARDDDRDDRRRVLVELVDDRQGRPARELRDHRVDLVLDLLRGDVGRLLQHEPDEDPRDPLAA